VAEQTFSRRLNKPSTNGDYCVIYRIEPPNVVLVVKIG